MTEVEKQIEIIRKAYEELKRLEALIKSGQASLKIIVIAMEEKKTNDN